MQKLTTVAQVLDWYEANEVRQFAPVAAAERKRLWNLFRAQYGTEDISSCCAAVLLHFIGSQKGCHSNHTRKRIRATICRPFNAAFDVGLIHRNPFRGVKIQRGRRGRDWKQEEFQAALRAASPTFRRLLVFLRFSGARPGEAREMFWSQVLWNLEVIVQDSHKTSGTTDDPRRIYFNDVIVKLLLWIKKHHADPRYVFVNSHGQPWTIGSITHYLRGVRSRAGLPNDLKAHGLRHTFCTAAITNNVDLKTVAELAGHATVRTTELYLHLLNKKKWMNDAANRAVGRRKIRRDDAD